MNRYKLIEPLPMYEVGDKGFYIDSDGNLMHRAAYAGETVYPAAMLARHPEILTDWFEEIPEQPKTVYDLKEGDTCYQISGTLITTCEWRNHESQRLRRDIGDITLTREEAEKKIAWRKAREILLRDTKGFKPNWTDSSQDRFCVSFYLLCKNRTKDNLGHLQVENAKWSITREIYFASQADAEASIKAHEKEWKIYLGVEE